MSRRASLFVISAPSGTGKSTVLARVLAAVGGLRFSVSHTTRAARASERDGVEYHFVSRTEFEALIAAEGFLEWAEVHGELYGTSQEEYRRALEAGVDLLLDVDVQGAAQVRLRFPEAVTTFLLPPSRRVLEERLRGRGGLEAAVVERRLRGAVAEVARWREYDYALVNNDVESCARSLELLIQAARLRTGLDDSLLMAAVASFQQ